MAEPDLFMESMKTLEDDFNSELQRFRSALESVKTALNTEPQRMVSFNIEPQRMEENKNIADGMRKAVKAALLDAKVQLVKSTVAIKDACELKMLTADQLRACAAFVGKLELQKGASEKTFNYEKRQWIEEVPSWDGDQWKAKGLEPPSTIEITKLEDGFYKELRHWKDNRQITITWRPDDIYRNKNRCRPASDKMEVIYHSNPDYEEHVHHSLTYELDVAGGVNVVIWNNGGNRTKCNYQFRP